MVDRPAVDWRDVARRRLGDAGLAPEAEAAVVDELAGLLEDAWAAEGPVGASAEQVRAWAARQIPSGETLARSIARHAPESARARPAAVRNLGTRRGRGGSSMTGLLHDLRLAGRQLGRAPLFTFVAVFTLAVGIGLNSAVFSVVNAMLFAPLPVASPDRLVRVYNQQPSGFLDHEPVSHPDYRDIAEQSTALVSLVASNATFFAFEHLQVSEMVIGELASGDYFATLGLRPALGRLIGPADDRPGEPAFVAVLNHGTWRRRFDSAPDVLGATIRVNGNPMTVVGVAPEGWNGLTKGLAPEVWVPLALAGPLRVKDTFGPAGMPGALEEDRARRWLSLTGRLAPGADLERLRSELSTIGARLAQTYPESNAERTFSAFPARDVRIMPGVDDAVVTASLVLMVMVGLVLLIACANVASMLLARAADRRKEIATRLSLGASRAAVGRQLLAESLLLSVLGAGAGLLLALVSNRAITGIRLPLAVNIDLGLAIDLRVLVFTSGVAVATALVFGLAPALDAGRTDLVAALRDKASASLGRVRLRRLLVVAQVAVSLMLLTGAGLAVRSLWNAQQADPGFRLDGVAVATFAPQLQGYDEDAIEAFYERLAERVLALPGVEEVSYASFLPLTLMRNTSGVASDELHAAPSDDWPSIDTSYVDAGYFEALDIQVRQGRVLTPHDDRDAPTVVVVNEALAAAFWPGENAVGKRVWTDEQTASEVVGVVANGKVLTLGEAPRPFLFQAMRQGGPARRVLLARTLSDPQPLPGAIRRTARGIDPRITISDLRTLREATSAALLLPRAGALVFGLFGLLGLLLAAVGLYGLIAYSVSRRTHEIGIRVAMGAKRRDILALVVREGMVLTVVGVGIGLAAAAGLSRAIDVILYGVGPTDVPTFLGVALFLLAITLAATLIPARRAARLDPQTALRYE